MQLLMTHEKQKEMENSEPDIILGKNRTTLGATYMGSRRSFRSGPLSGHGHSKVCFQSDQGTDSQARMC